MPTTTRTARLVLGSLSVPLDDPDGGWICTELDLGYPDVRAVTNPNPVAHGIVDRSKFFGGGRTVTAKIMAYPGRLTLDQAVAQFAPFMDVEARPTLHYTTDGDTTERVLTLRTTAWSAPMGAPPERPFQLSWIAPDPIAQDANAQLATAWSGAGGTGRTYNLTFNRTYPTGSTKPVSGTIQPHGDVAVLPLLRIYGPIQGAWVQFATNIQPSAAYYVKFLPTFRIDATHRVEVDCAAHTAFLDGDVTQNVLGQLDWTQTVWPILPPAPDYTYMTLSGTNTSDTTQVQASWNDRYLT